MCPAHIVTIDMVVQAGGSWRVHLSTDHGLGKARTVLEFDHEPSRGELELGTKEWVKSLHSPPELGDIHVGGV
jgi:hypothetical protein